jgi:hypothetical protein
MRNSNPLRPLVITLLEGVIRDGDAATVAAMVPPLVERLAPSPHLVMLLAARPELAELSGQLAGRLERYDASSLLNDHPNLPGAVQQAIFAAHGRSSYVAKTLARRRTLDRDVAARLASRTSGELRRILAHNLTAPVDAVWRSLNLVKRNASGTRWSVERALELAANELAAISSDDAADTGAGYQPSVTDRVSDAVRVLPGRLTGRNGEFIADELRLHAEAGLLRDLAVAAWVERGIDDDLRPLLLELVAAMSDSAAGHGWTSGAVAEVLCVADTFTDVRIWPHADTVDQALDSPVALINAAALANPAAAELLRSFDDTRLASLSDLALKAAARNPALDRDTAVRIAARLDQHGWMIADSAVLTDDDRLSLLRGPAGERCAVQLAGAVTATVRPAWLARWWTPELLSAAVTAAGRQSAGSVLLDAAVRSWPDRLADLAAGVKLNHSVSALLADEIVSRVVKLDAEQSTIAAGLIGDWDSSIAGLVRAAEAI